MLVDVLAGRDRLRGDPDRLAVFQDLLAGGDVDQRELMAVGHRVADGDVAPGPAQLRAGGELAARQRHWIAGVKLDEDVGELHRHRPFCTHAWAGSR